MQHLGQITSETPPGPKPEPKESMVQLKEIQWIEFSIQKKTLKTVIFALVEMHS